MNRQHTLVFSIPIIFPCILLDGETVEAKQDCCTTGGPWILILLETGKLGLEFLKKQFRYSPSGSSTTAEEIGSAGFSGRDCVVLENRVLGKSHDGSITL